MNTNGIPYFSIPFPKKLSSEEMENIFKKVCKDKVKILTSTQYDIDNEIF
ncbi:hypothetical protein [Bacteriovorax sp. Seq25_V]|nr:hypothetical protein [Bacteriovorax sp. Seq25_V]EQC47239.1 hypothetical protein M900_0912 [Bacteriovorax sp. Seq25_V]